MTSDVRKVNNLKRMDIPRVITRSEKEAKHPQCLIEAILPMDIEGKFGI
jgi:hypothetical protein